MKNNNSFTIVTNCKLCGSTDQAKVLHLAPIPIGDRYVPDSEKAKGFVAEKGFDQKFGARPLKRAIQKYIEDPLAEDIINSNLKEGDTIKISLNKKGEKGLIIKVVKAKKKKSEQAEKDKLEG